MFHACVQRFDVTGNLEKFCKILGTKQALISIAFCQRKPSNHKAYHIPWSRKIIPTGRISLTSTLRTQGLFTHVAGNA